MKTDRESVVKRALAYIDATHPFVRSVPQIVMRKHWLRDFMVDFAISECEARDARIAELEVELGRYERMMACEPNISFWMPVNHPVLSDDELTLAQFAEGGPWSWFEKGHVLPNAPLFDTVLDAFDGIHPPLKGEPND